MKIRYTLLIVSILCFVISLWHFTSTRKKISTQEISEVSELTSIKFDKTLIDVGVQKLNVPVEIDFTVYNIGNHDLHIQKIQPDCHCTVANFPQRAISPNDSALIRLKYDASNLGPFQSSATVTTNSNSSVVLLVFRGIVEK